MRIVTRKVITSHSKEEIFQIMKDASSRYRPAEFADDCFKLAFPTRWHRQPGIIPVKGTVKEQDGFTEVQIEIHGSISFCVGMLFFCVGILVSVYSLLVKAVSIYPALVGFGIGIFLYVIDLFDGITCLDSLEHRLTRKLDE